MEIKNNQSNEADIVIDFREIIRSILHFLPAIVFMSIIGVLIAYLGCVLFSKPKYSSTTKLYMIANEQHEKDHDYEEIINSPEVTESVISNLSLKNSDGRPMTSKDLAGKMFVNIPKDTRVVNITIEDEDPYRACDIANATREVAERRIKNIIDMKTVKTISGATISTSPDSPNPIHIAEIGGLGGFILSVIAAIIYYVLECTGPEKKSLKKTRLNTILGIIAALLMVITAFVYLSKDKQPPTINFPRTKLTYTDHTDVKQLLSGVTATDNKDGDVTSSLRISFVIPNDNHTRVTVEYLAKDHSNNIVKTSRVYNYQSGK